MGTLEAGKIADVLVVSGEEDPTTTNPLPQVWQVGSNSWRNLTNAQLVQALYPAMFVAPNGKVFNAGPWQATRYLDTSGTGAWSAGRLPRRRGSTST